MQARLLVTIIKNGYVISDGREYILNGVTKIGRGKDCSIHIPDLSLASRCHATIARISRKLDTGLPRYSIIDGCVHNGKSKKSVNGIKINGLKIDSAELVCGDRITIVSGTAPNGDVEFCELIYLTDKEKEYEDDTIH